MNTPNNIDTILQDTHHWLETAVIGLNLCPFAKAPYNKNRVRIHISQARHLDGFLEDLDAEIQHLLHTSAEETETTLLVHPTLFPDFLVFNDMLELAEGALDDHDAIGTLQIAPFHPDFCFEGSQDTDISNFTNRSPYPTLHLIRESSIEKASQSFPDPAVIFERNIRLLEEMGHEGWQKLNIARHGKDDAA